MKRPKDPLAARSPVLLWLFSWYLRWYLRRHFHGVRVSRAGLPQLPTDRPVVIYCNHPSWWDPALMILVGTKLLRDRIGYGPMEAAQLERYGLLRRMGVFGIDPSSTRGAAAFLQVSRRILADPRHTLWVTAEGQFVDPRRRPVRLRPGISHLARHLPGVIFLPLAIEYVFWNESRPEALVRFGPAVAIDPQQETAEVTAILGSALTRTMDALADESMTRDPGLFLPLIRGRAGVGGIYDLWRRLCAWTAGRSFDPSHGTPAESGRQ